MLNDTQNHPSEDELLLLAYGELPAPRTTEVESHLAACATCRDDFGRLERARVALEVAAGSRVRARRLRGRWIVATLAAAAAVAAVLIRRPEPLAEVERGWQPPAVWSATAGYMAGGPPVVQIDAQLTRLEKERYHGLSN